MSAVVRAPRAAREAISLLQALPEPWASLEWAALPAYPAGMSWAGGHRALFSAVHDGSPVLAKTPRWHTEMLSNAEDYVALVRAAGEQGIAPAVLAADPSTGVIVQPALSGRIGTLHRAGSPEFLAAYLIARRNVRQLEVELSPRDLFADLGRLLAELASRGLSISAEADRILAALPDLRGAVSAGPEPTPVWGSGEISNVTFTDVGAFLTGGTRGGSSDPLVDVGIVLTEISPFITDDDEVMRLLWGDTHPGARARARIYGIVDELRAAALALLADHLDPDSPLEYSGHHAWRVRRATAILDTQGGLESWITDASKGWR